MPKYIKVRIAVAVDTEGWISAGWSDASDIDLMSSVVSNMPLAKKYWLTAELEIGEEVSEVKATHHLFETEEKMTDYMNEGD